MTHLTQEDLILAYYRELDSDAHLAACEECRNELARLAKVLDQVTPLEVPEPADDYEARVWDRLAWRLPAERRRRKSAPRRATWIAVAATVALAFLAGILVTRRDGTVAPQVATANAPQSSAQPVVAASTQQQRDRILLVVVGDHFDQSERMLVELTNLAPAGATDITTERARAEELLASNRLYRSTAAERGEESVATLLDELEPVLLQLAHAPSQVGAEELRSIQKRVEAKGLVFKLRVVRADVRNETRTTTNTAPTI